MVSHEMRTPLLSIIFFLHAVINMLINGQLGDDQVLKMIEMCGNSVNQIELIQSFVDDLLDLGQLKSGTFSLAKEPMDV